MQLFIVFLVLAIALGWCLWRIAGTLRGRGDCGCGNNCHCKSGKCHCNAHSVAKDCNRR